VELGFEFWASFAKQAMPPVHLVSFFITFKQKIEMSLNMQEISKMIFPLPSLYSSNRITGLS
jgi:hypothetical protein